MNDSMGSYVAQETVKMMIKRGVDIKTSKALILGITFKENCPDIRNSRVIDIIKEFETFGVHVDVYDPLASPIDVKQEYNLDVLSNASEFKRNYDAIVIAVAHQEFLEIDIESLKLDKAVVFDVKSLLPKHLVDARL